MEQIASQAWVASPNVVEAQMKEELALLDFSSNSYFTLNAVGSAIWSALSEPRTVDDVAKAVAAQFDITQDACKPDVQEMMGALRDSGLIRTADGLDEQTSSPG